MTEAHAPPPPASSGDIGGFGPWLPGIESQVPRPLRHLMTLFRPEHVFGDYEKARELADFSGLPELDVLALRPERLALHEVLVRVTADYTVPDGTRIEDLGISFRDIVRTLFAGGVAPRIDEVVAVYHAARQRLAAAIAVELAAASAPALPPPGPAHRGCDGSLAAAQRQSLRSRRMATNVRRSPPGRHGRRAPATTSSARRAPRSRASRRRSTSGTAERGAGASSPRRSRSTSRATTTPPPKSAARSIRGCARPPTSTATAGCPRRQRRS
jgi:hypothetical protein